MTLDIVNQKSLSTNKQFFLSIIHTLVSYKLSGCWLCLRLLLFVLVSFGLFKSIEGLRGLPSVTSALATANPDDCPEGECGKPPVKNKRKRKDVDKDK